jgi:hypothetical protein
MMGDCHAIVLIASASTCVITLCYPHGILQTGIDFRVGQVAGRICVGVAAACGSFLKKAEAGDKWLRRAKDCSEI